MSGEGTAQVDEELVAEGTVGAVADFTALGISPDIVEGLQDLGYERPTPVQQAGLKALIEGRDLIASAPAGVGRTATWGLAMIEKIDVESDQLQGLVVVADRERAIQANDALHQYGRPLESVATLPVWSAPLSRHQEAVLSRGVHVVVATPGALKELVGSEQLDLSNLKLLAIDGADTIAAEENGLADLEWILDKVDIGLQTAIFAGEYNEELEKFATSQLPEPLRAGPAPAPELELPPFDHGYRMIDERLEIELLANLLCAEVHDSVLIVARHREGAHEAADALEARGFRPAVATLLDLDHEGPVDLNELLDSGEGMVIVTDALIDRLIGSEVQHLVQLGCPGGAEGYLRRLEFLEERGRSTMMVPPRERPLMEAMQRELQIRFNALGPIEPNAGAPKYARLERDLRGALGQGPNAHLLRLVDELCAEGTHGPAEIAAAALSMALRSIERPQRSDERRAGASDRRAGGFEERRGGFDRGPDRGGDRGSFGDRDRGSFGDRDRGGFGDRDRGPRRQNNEVEPGMTRLFVNCGRWSGVRPGDLVRTIATVCDMPGSELGAIRITDKFSLVDVPDQYADRVIERLQGADLRGRAVQVHRDRHA
jgi:ATP-dependent RNA helicase DeaD